MSCFSRYIEVREQCYEYSPVQLFAASLLAAELYGCLHMVAAIRRRERSLAVVPANGVDTGDKVGERSLHPSIKNVWVKVLSIFWALMACPATMAPDYIQCSSRSVFGERGAFCCFPKNYHSLCLSLTGLCPLFLLFRLHRPI